MQEALSCLIKIKVALQVLPQAPVRQALTGLCSALTIIEVFPSFDTKKVVFLMKDLPCSMTLRHFLCAINWHIVFPSIYCW